MQDTTTALNSIGYLVARTHKALKKQFRPIVKRYGLTEPQYGVLRCLYFKDGLSSRELADMIFMDSSTVMSVVDRLEDKKLVRRQSNSVDRRITNICLTDKAKSFLPEVTAEVDKLDQRIRTQLSAEAITSLINGLNTLYTYSSTIRLNKDELR